MVRGLYEPNPADPDGPTLPELELRFRMPDGNPLLIMFDADRLAVTDLGYVTPCLAHVAGRLPMAAVRAIASSHEVIASSHEVMVGLGDEPELSRRLDVADPGEDAMAFVACLLQVAALARVTPTPARPNRRR